MAAVRFRLLWRLVLLPLVLPLVMSACGSSDQSSGRESWGDEAVNYFAELSRAYTDDDFYGVLDFYSTAAVVQDRTSDFLGATVPVSDWLASHRADLSRDLLDVHLGVDEAVTLIAWPGSGDLGAIVTELEGGLIARDSIFVDVDSLEKSLRASPGLIRTYESLYARFAELWSTESADGAASLYAPAATLSDPLAGIEATGREAISRLVQNTSERWKRVLVEVISGEEAASAGDSALYLDPISYGRDPQRAVGLYEVDYGDGCSIQTAIHWTIADGAIVDERRYPEVESFRRCASGDLVSGWWTGLGLPSPRDQVVTGIVPTSSGQQIEIHNGTPDLNDLVRWGLQRFAVAGLAEPRVDAVTFEPTRRCEGVLGRVVDDEVSRDLVLCIDERDLCRVPGTCDVLPLAIRAGILHELGHAWLLDHTDSETRIKVLELSGRAVWTDEGEPWIDRGVEYAAEVLAWGLADEVIRLERLGDPPCEQLAAVFDALTGKPPQEGCVDRR